MEAPFCVYSLNYCTHPNSAIVLFATLHLTSYTCKKTCMTQLFQLRQHLHSLSVLRFYFRTSTVISALFSWISFNYTESPLCIIFCDYFILHFITMIIISEITKLFCYKLKILALFNVIIFSMSLSPSYPAHQTIFCSINILFAIYTIWSFCNKKRTRINQI